MDQRLDLYAGLVDSHRPLFERHLHEVLLAQEPTAIDRLAAWEQLIQADPHPADEWATLR